MATDLPEITRESFAERLSAALGEGVGDEVLGRLLAHYAELRRWNRRLSLVGPGDRDRVVERHYAESLAALSWLPRGPATLVDVGSGGGFPGWVLAAARPDLDVTLVEPRQRKWAFLSAAAARAALPVRCVDARVGASLPDGLPQRLDVVTVRALRLDADALAALAGRMPPGASLLFWRGGVGDAPGDGFESGRERRLPGGERRYLAEWLRRP